MGEEDAMSVSSFFVHIAQSSFSCVLLFSISLKVASAVWSFGFSALPVKKLTCSMVLSGPVLVAVRLA